MKKNLSSLIRVSDALFGEEKNESKSDVKHQYRKIQLVAGYFKKTAIKNIKLYYGL